MHQPYTINQSYQQSRHRGRVLAAIQKVFAVFYHNKFKKNMPENLELPGEWKYASEVGFVRIKLRRIVLVRIIFYIFMGCALTSNAFGEDPIQLQLDAFYAEYDAIVANPTIPKYIELDRKLRAFFSEDVWEFSPKLEWKDRFKYANERTRAFGIIPGKFYMALEYTEILLVKAHEMNPHSKYREYTLFSQIMGIRPEGGLGQMPNIKVAYQYAKEFPNGPFIPDVYRIIASFHKDLFMIVRGLSEGKRDYMYDYCFKPYVERRPYEEQMAQNKRIALRYYGKFKKELDAGAKRPRWFRDSIIDELNAGTVEAWSFCGD